MIIRLRARRSARPYILGGCCAQIGFVRKRSPDLHAIFVAATTTTTTSTPTGFMCAQNIDFFCIENWQTVACACVDIFSYTRDGAGSAHYMHYLVCTVRLWETSVSNSITPVAELCSVGARPDDKHTLSDTRCKLAKDSRRTVDRCAVYHVCIHYLPLFFNVCALSFWS